ncbi:MAG: Holliday junction branch migration protein RuvA [Parcubacteria group bacterium]|nr:Holliday junction branch migration protein RuvA [Parcubacteria group bacterium]MBI2636803.1 Holliday junction branch migration protein RuvA [Parcubacteria group bacterium]
MIASISGKIVKKTGTAAIVAVNGVGYKVSVPANELVQLNGGQSVFLFTHLAVKEDALDLYGSQDEQVLQWFVMLLNVKGIGPKSSLSIMSIARPQDLSAALQAESPDVLVHCGVSKKVAERIVLELPNKAKDLIDIKDAATKESIILDGEALQAMEALGYSREQAREALKEAEGDDVGARVKSALKLLGK